MRRSPALADPTHRATNRQLINVFALAYVPINNLAIIESSGDCVVVWDKNYNYLYANKNSIEHVGTTKDKVIGKNITDGLGHIPDFMNLWIERIDKVFETGKPNIIR
jgi:PAS domain-containing protein